MFEVEADTREPLEAVTDPALRGLLDYWTEKCAGRRMPSRADIDPLDMRRILGRMHLLDVLGRNRFRYRVYGSAITNPDVRDMTGQTTLDYKNREFGALVTAHYQECVDERAPVYRHIVARLQGRPYEYYRLTLPLSADGEEVNMLMAAPLRIAIPIGLPRNGPIEYS